MTIFEAFMMITILIAGGFAVYKLDIFRELKPHLTMEHAVTHRKIGDEYAHIAIRVSLTNSSKVAVEIAESTCVLQQISPLAQQEVEALYREYFESLSESDIQWPLLHRLQRNWSQNELIVEPNGKHVEYFETIVSDEMQTVLVSTYYRNASYSANDNVSKGWELASAHDLD